MEVKMSEEKKSIFDKAIDAFTNRDEKAAAEAAQKEAEAAQMQAEMARRQAEAAKLQAAAANAEMERLKAEKLRADALAAQQQAEMQRQAQIRAEQAKAAEAARLAAEAAKAAVIKHVWTKEDTYASLAQKYYGSIKEPHWRLIYEHNKSIIGNHPNDIRLGLEIEIPPLPDDLKKK
jgi:HD superfamily phosphohydrolase